MDDLIIVQEPFERIPLKGREVVATRCMMEGMDKLLNTGVHFQIGCGTFLGLYRDGIYIPHDLDIDISAVMDWNEGWKEGEDKIFNEFNCKGWRFIRSIRYKDRICQMAYINEEDVIFDITFYYTGIIDGRVVSYSDQGSVVENLHLFKSFIPHPAKEYLEQRYGKGWRIPTGEQRPRNYITDSLNPTLGVGLT